MQLLALTINNDPVRVTPTANLITALPGISLLDLVSRTQPNGVGGDVSV